MAADWRLQTNNQTISGLNLILLQSGLFSDVEFVVGKEETKLKAHTLIMSTRSSVFEAMFNESWINSHDRNEQGVLQIRIPEIRAKDFNLFLKFCYGDCRGIIDAPMECLYIAHKYNVTELVKILLDHLEHSITIANVIGILTASRLYDSSKLYQATKNYLLKSAPIFVVHSSFLKLDIETLGEIISDNALQLDELCVFYAVLRWAEHQCSSKNIPTTVANRRQSMQSLIPLIRFPLMTPEEFSSDVVRTGILTNEEIIQIFVSFSVTDPDKRKELTSIEFSDIPRRPAKLDNPDPQPRLLSKQSFIVNVYLGSERSQVRRPFTVGPRGKVHDGALDFVVDHNVVIIGIGLYGPQPADLRTEGYIPRTYSAEVCIYSHSTWDCNSGEQPFTCSVDNVPARGDYDINFDHPIIVPRDKLHHVRIVFKGIEFAHGSSRLSTHSTICGNETVTFRFVGPPLPFMENTDGRIRSLIFYPA